MKGNSKLAKNHLATATSRQQNRNNPIIPNTSRDSTFNKFASGNTQTSNIQQYQSVVKKTMAQSDSADLSSLSTDNRKELADFIKQQVSKELIEQLKQIRLSGKEEERMRALEEDLEKVKEKVQQVQDSVKQLQRAHQNGQEKENCEGAKQNLGNKGGTTRQKNFAKTTKIELIQNPFKGKVQKLKETRKIQSILSMDLQGQLKDQKLDQSKEILEDFPSPQNAKANGSNVKASGSGEGSLFKAIDVLSPSNREGYQQAYQTFGDGSKRLDKGSSSNRQLFQFNKQAVLRTYKCGSERTSDKKKKKKGPQSLNQIWKDIKKSQKLSKGQYLTLDNRGCPKALLPKTSSRASSTELRPGGSDLGQEPFNLTGEYTRMGKTSIQNNQDSLSQSPIAKELCHPELRKAHKNGTPEQSPGSKKSSFYHQGNEERTNKKCRGLGKLGDDGPGQKIATQGILLLRKLARDGCVCLRKRVEQSSSKTTLQEDSMARERKPSTYQDSPKELEDEENPDFVCGEYCRKLAPKDQKAIVRNVMRRLHGPNLNIFANKGDQGFINERKYVVDAKWWRRWCDYTGFETANKNLPQEDASDQQQMKTSPSLNDKETIVLEQDSTLRSVTTGTSDRGHHFLKKNVKERAKMMVEKTIASQKSKRTPVKPENKQEEPFESSNMKALRIEIMQKKRPYLSQNRTISEKAFDGQERIDDQDSRQLFIVDPFISTYKHPGKIKNIQLLEDQEEEEEREMGSPLKDNLGYQLKPNLVEHYDYEAVPLDIWRYLSSWYSYDIALPRYIIFDGRIERMYLDLYPRLQL